MSLAATRVPELCAFITGVVLFGARLWFLHWRFQKKLAAVFSRHHRDRPALAEIKDLLDDLNLDSAHFIFTADRHANILFRGEEVTLIYGRVGSRSPGGIRGPIWTLRKAVYAIAGRARTSGMKDHPDAFTPAMSGVRFSVYWVKLEAFLAA